MVLLQICKIERRWIDSHNGSLGRSEKKKIGRATVVAAVVVVVVAVVGSFFLGSSYCSDCRGY
jgi:hypothetical protein